MWGFLFGLVQAIGGAIWRVIFPTPAAPPIAVTEAAQAATASERASVAQQAAATQAAVAQAVIDAPASQAAIVGSLDAGAF